MKKLFKTIKIKPLFKKEFKEEQRKYTQGYIVLFKKTDTYKLIYNKDDLLSLLEQDNKEKIAYIFDLTDRIIVDRNIKVEDMEDE